MYHHCMQCGFWFFNIFLKHGIDHSWTPCINFLEYKIVISTGCPKINFTTLIPNNFQTKSHIVKQNAYLKSANLHKFF